MKGKGLPSKVSVLSYIAQRATAVFFTGVHRQTRAKAVLTVRMKVGRMPTVLLRTGGAGNKSQTGECASQLVVAGC